MATGDLSKVEAQHQMLNFSGWACLGGLTALAVGRAISHPVKAPITLLGLALLGAGGTLQLFQWCTKPTQGTEKVSQATSQIFPNSSTPCKNNLQIVVNTTPPDVELQAELFTKKEFEEYKDLIDSMVSDALSLDREDYIKRIYALVKNCLVSVLDLIEPLDSPQLRYLILGSDAKTAYFIQVIKKYGINSFNSLEDGAKILVFSEGFKNLMNDNPTLNLKDLVYLSNVQYSDMPNIF